MNTSQFLSLARWLLNSISGGVIAYTAAKSPAVQGVGAYVAQLITGPDAVAAVVLGITWLWGHLTHSSPPPVSGASPKSPLPPMVLLAVCAGGLLLTGCAHLAPGSRAVVVRAEQSITLANATFDSAIHIDDANRPFFRTNAPAFHAFCEWLRVPVVILPLTNSLPRGLAIVESADAVKNAYKQTSGTNEYAFLISSLAVVESVTSEAQKFIAQTATATR